MADVPTLLARIEALQSGDPLPGDTDPVPGGHTVGAERDDAASLRVNGLCAAVDHVPARLACELYDNVETIKAALRYWSERHR